jgi:hypothetical protein
MFCKYSTNGDIEDDIDWDVSLKSQLLDMARGSRFLSANNTQSSPISPYGDDWDVLWLGHCGSTIHADDGRRVIISDDPTVPLKQNLHTPAGAPPDYEWAINGTRILYKAGSGSCTWAYAVSFRGAHRLLNAMSVDPFNSPFDLGMGALCSWGVLNCFAVYPPIFGAHAPIGVMNKESDINNNGGQFRDKGRTHNVAYSVKMNLKHLMNGERDKAESQFENMPKIAASVGRRYIQ